jgi:hypothetical protein
MYVEPAPESSDSDDEGSLTLVMSEFKKQMEEIERASKAIDTQITNLYSRVKEESVDWMNEPLVPRPPLKAWLKAKGYPPHPTVEEFLDICYASAKTMDLESRVVCFHKDDAAALWNGQRRLTVFDIVGLIPTLFE